MPRPKWHDVVVVLGIVGALGVGSVYFVKAIGRLDERADRNSALSFSDREIAGGNTVLVDQEAAYEALVLIGPTQAYRVITGDRLRNAKPLTASFVDGWFRYFLIPRRPSRDARWIICYGCDTSRLGGRYIVRWHDANGISIGHLG
jgi:hypothetical protein